MKPERSDVKNLESWSTQAFARWLGAALKSWFEEEKSRRFFAPMHTFVDLEMSVAQDLAAVHDVLLPIAASRMREGMAIALAYSDNCKVVEELLDLAALTVAWDILPVVPDKLDYFFRNDDPGAEELLVKALFAVAAVSTNAGNTELTDDALKCLRYIVCARGFPPAFAGGVLTTLCRIVPHKLDTHLKLMRPYLDKILDYVLEEEEEEEEERRRENQRRDLVNEVCRFVDLEALSYPLRLKPNKDAKGRDEWWRKTVEHYVEIERTEHNFNIKTPVGKSITVPLFPPHKNIPMSTCATQPIPFDEEAKKLNEKAKKENPVESFFDAFPSLQDGAKAAA